MPALVTATRAALLLGVPTSERLEALLEVASAQLEGAVGFPLHHRAATVACLSPGGAYLWTRDGLLREITAITLDGATFDPSSYAISDATAGRVVRTQGSWPQTARRGGSPDSTALQSIALIQLEGTFGFVAPSQATPELLADVPTDVELAVSLMARHTQLGTMAAGLASKSLGASTVTFDRASLAQLPPEVFAVIARLRGTRGVIGL